MQWLGVETARCDNHLGGRTQFVLFFARRARRYLHPADCSLKKFSRPCPDPRHRKRRKSAEKVLASTSPAI